MGRPSDRPVVTSPCHSWRRGAALCSPPSGVSPFPWDPHAGPVKVDRVGRYATIESRSGAEKRRGALRNIAAGGPAIHQVGPAVEGRPRKGRQSHASSPAPARPRPSQGCPGRPDPDPARAAPARPRPSQGCPGPTPTQPGLPWPNPTQPGLSQPFPIRIRPARPDKFNRAGNGRS